VVEAIVFCGVPGAGKSTFFKERFFATHVRISRDLLRTPHREAVFLRACLETRQRFVVDKVNPTRGHRAPYVAEAAGAGFAVVAYWFDVPARTAAARNEQRTGRDRVPLAAVFGTAKALEPPAHAEGFAQVFRVAPGSDVGTVTVEEL